VHLERDDRQPGLVIGLGCTRSIGALTRRDQEKDAGDEAGGDEEADRSSPSGSS